MIGTSASKNRKIVRNFWWAATSIKRAISVVIVAIAANAAVTEVRQIVYQSEFA